MKQIFAIIIFLVVSWQLNAQSQIKSIPQDYASSFSSPLMFKSGDSILINCDTIYVINSLRYEFYKSMHLSIQNESDTACKSLLSAYEKRLIEHEEAYRLLSNNCKQYEQTTEALIKNTKSKLEQSQNTLRFAQESLDKTTQELEMAQDIIKKERWKSKGRSLLIGIGGIGIGLITGILIAK